LHAIYDQNLEEHVLNSSSSAEPTMENPEGDN